MEAFFKETVWQGGLDEATAELRHIIDYNSNNGKLYVMHKGRILFSSLSSFPPLFFKGREERGGLSSLPHFIFRKRDARETYTIKKVGNMCASVFDIVEEMKTLDGT